MAHVLLIEPDIMLAGTYAQALRHFGHRVSSVYTAQDAIMAADSQVPDLVILELQLAVHDGLEFLYEFRSYGEWQQIPVVINSVLDPARLEAMRHTLHTLGVTACLYKPRVTLTQLASIVRRQVPHAV